MPGPRGPGFFVSVQKVFALLLLEEGVGSSRHDIMPTRPLFLINNDEGEP